MIVCLYYKKECHIILCRTKCDILSDSFNNYISFLHKKCCIPNDNVHPYDKLLQH